MILFFELLWSHLGYDSTESKTRTEVRTRAQRVARRIRIRHATTRIRAAIGARQNNGVARCLTIVI